MLNFTQINNLYVQISGFVPTKTKICTPDHVRRSPYVQKPNIYSWKLFELERERERERANLYVRGPAYAVRRTKIQICTYKKQNLYVQNPILRCVDGLR